MSAQNSQKAGIKEGMFSLHSIGRWCGVCIVHYLNIVGLIAVLPPLLSFLYKLKQNHKMAKRKVGTIPFEQMSLTSVHTALLSS
jgi:hypothetical protein